MHDIGTALLYVAFVATLATGLTGLAGAWLRSPGLLAAARHGLVGSWLVFLAMGAALIYGLVTHDFDNKYIAAYTDSDMPMAYLLAGFWGGEKGALLFWTTSLTTFSVWAVLRNRSQSQVFLGYVTSFLALAAFFFVVLMVFESNPFETFLAGAGPDDGKGMNPLLQNPLMAIHPPSLLTGYIAFTVPYAFGLAALVTGQLDSQWLRDTRTWTLVSWLFLSLGLILGGAWAYEELGWGGFWMWDPVENAGLIPWFTATAFLHSVMIQERRNMLKRWNAVLVCLTFLLTIFGTFLTRSQLIDSVHSFADSTIAVYFLWYMAFIAVISIAALAWRWKALRSDAELDSLMSRESFFILNNVLLVGCAFVVAWGTLFSQISEAKAVQDLYNFFVNAVGAIGIHVQPMTQGVQLGEPWFNRVMTPLGLLLLVLTGIGPLISWRRATRKNFERNFRRPVVGSSLSTLVLVGIWAGQQISGRMQWDGLDFSSAVMKLVDGLGGRDLYGFVSVWFGMFVAWTIAIEFHVGARARQKIHGSSYLVSLVLLTLRNKRRYGGYIVHLGVVLCFLAFTGNAYRIYEPEVALHPGDKKDIGGYSLLFTGSVDRYEPDGAYAYTHATVVAVDRDSKVSDDKVAEVAAMARKTGAKVSAQAVPGTPRVSLIFDDALVGRRFAARQFAGRLGEQIKIVGSDAQDPHVLHMTLGEEIAAVAEVVPQAVMKVFGDVREYGKERAPSPVEVRTVPGQPGFDLVFVDKGELDRFVADLKAGPWPGLLHAAVNAKVQLTKGVQVDVVPEGVGNVLYPEARFYKKHSSPTTEVAIKSTFSHDLYLAMRPAQGQRYINLLAVVFPFVSFLWLGAIVMLFGAFVALIPTRQAPVTAREESTTGPVA